MIRAFVGVRIDPNVVEKISAVQSQLKRSLSGVRWVGRENLHFTLKFLGPIEEKKAASITEALEEALRLFPRFPILARGIGVFPDMRRARVLWVGLEGQSLLPLATRVETALEAVGFQREQRGFKPHLTIGRWRNFNGSPELLRSEIGSWKGYDFGQSWVREVVFFQSILRSEGAIYHPVSVIRLSN